MTLKVGLLVGREWSFPPAFIDEVNRRGEGVTADRGGFGDDRDGHCRFGPRHAEIGRRARRRCFGPPPSTEVQSRMAGRGRTRGEVRAVVRRTARNVS